jgi:protein-tyrosine phosphatase
MLEFPVKTLNANAITERVWTGGLIYDIGQMATLRELGITHVIDASNGSDNGKMMRAFGVAYLKNRTEDDGAEKPLSWFKPALDFAMSALAKRGTKVLAHCEVGVNRGPSLAYAILRAQGLSAEDALVLIKSRRKIACVAYDKDAEKALVKLGWVK